MKTIPYDKNQWDAIEIRGFKYAASLDLNMGYCNIQISENASNLCTSIVPWGKYRYKCLTMGVANSSDIFKQKMNDLFHGLEFICAHIDDILILSKG